MTLGCFIYILDSSYSSSITFWTSQFGSSSRSNWTGIWTGSSNGSWTDKQSSHFSKRDECKSYILFYVKTTTNKFWNDAEMLLKSFWTSHCRMMNGLEPPILELNWWMKGKTKRCRWNHSYVLIKVNNTNLLIT